MARYPHLLRSARGDTYPSHIICIGADSWLFAQQKEGLNVVPTIARWVAYATSGSKGVYKSPKRLEGTTAEEFWHGLDLRLRRGDSPWIFAERACQLWSLLGLWAQLENGECYLDGSDERDSKRRAASDGRSATGRIILSDPPFCVDFRRAAYAGRVRAVDLANYGCGDTPRSFDCSAKAARCYDFVLGMISALRDGCLGSLKATVASQAEHTWRRRYLDCAVAVHTHDAALRLEGDSYYGGRAEAFRLGHVPGRVWHLDFASLYPSIYGQHELPVSLAGYADGMESAAINDIGDSAGIIAEVDLTTTEPAYPFRDAKKKIVYWPTGSFRTTLAGPEFWDAWRKGRVQNVVRAAWYTMGRPLRSYSQMVLRLRTTYAAHNDLKVWAKGLANHICGKFVQRDKHWESVTTNLLMGMWDMRDHVDREGAVTRYRSVAGQHQVQHEGGWTFDAVPCIGAWITSLGRMALLNAIRIAGWNHVHYVDTDSLFVSDSGMENLWDAGQLGEGEYGRLRLEGTPEILRIFGIKSYEADKRCVQAGLPVRHSGDGSSGWTAIRHHTAAGAFRERRRPDGATIQVKLARANVYKHGFVRQDGLIQPFHLEGNRSD